mmetsp:Transcript_35201/g.85689  ORF Transcript_35201/g.85689 Transcript_35201/m.85689 type:complete len:257 (-) Transcript_35201:439-1209(-)
MSSWLDGADDNGTRQDGTQLQEGRAWGKGQAEDGDWEAGHTCSRGKKGRLDKSVGQVPVLRGNPSHTGPIRPPLLHSNTGTNCAAATGTWAIPFRQCTTKRRAVSGSGKRASSKRQRRNRTRSAGNGRPNPPHRVSRDVFVALNGAHPPLSRPSSLRLRPLETASCNAPMALVVLVTTPRKKLPDCPPPAGNRAPWPAAATRKIHFQANGRHGRGLPCKAHYPQASLAHPAPASCKVSQLSAPGSTNRCPPQCPGS